MKRSTSATGASGINMTKPCIWLGGTVAHSSGFQQAGRGAREHFMGCEYLETSERPFVEPQRLMGQCAQLLVTMIDSAHPTSAVIHVIWDNVSLPQRADQGFSRKVD